MDYSDIAIQSRDEVMEIEKAICECIEEHAPGQKVNAVFNYDRFDCRSECVHTWTEMKARCTEKFFQSVRRVSGTAFTRRKLSTTLSVDHGHRFSLQDTINIARQRGLQSTGPEVVANRFRRVGVDDDGTISYDQFSQLLHSFVSAH